MKILLFSDIHWSTNSSIVRARGERYSIRLEHLIDSMNWVNKTAINEKCESMICLGDFFDKAVVNDEEMTALREINWTNLPCYFVCGNHESSVLDLRYSALTALECDNHYIVSEQCWSFKDGSVQIHFVPYIAESTRQPLENYLDKDDECSTHIVISHNEIMGINYGGFESKIGFSIKEIEDNCDLYLNGHLHNSECISKKILNVGSFSGHNFTNDSSRYKYGVWILDTETLKLNFIENPYGFNFYKFEINSNSPDRQLDNVDQLDKIKNNAVLSIKCDANLTLELEAKLNKLKDKIVDKRITYFVKQDSSTEESPLDIADLRVDHLEKLVEFSKKNINNDAVLDYELAQLCK